MQRILWHEHGKNIDEIVISDATVHIEQMDDRSYWVGIYPNAGAPDRYWMGNLVATPDGRLGFTEQENAGIEWDQDDTHDKPADTDNPTDQTATTPRPADTARDQLVGVLYALDHEDDAGAPDWGTVWAIANGYQLTGHSADVKKYQHLIDRLYTKVDAIIDILGPEPH